MAFAFPDKDLQAAWADLYSAAMLFLSDWYLPFDMVCAIAPALKARPIAIAITWISNLFMVVPLSTESVDTIPRWRNCPLSRPFSQCVDDCAFCASVLLCVGAHNAEENVVACWRRNCTVAAVCVTAHRELGGKGR